MVNNKKNNTSIKNNAMMKTDQQKDFKYKIGFNQSVSTGVIGLEGYVLFNDDIADMHRSIDGLIHSMRYFENELEKREYLVASDHAPKRNSSGTNANNNNKGE